MRPLPLAALALLAPLAHAQSIVGLGRVPGEERSTASGISADASAISGSWYYTTRGKIDACRWTRRADGIYEREDLSHYLVDRYSRGGSISADGSTMLMEAFSGPTVRHYALRSLPDGGTVLRELAPFSNNENFYMGHLSADGDVAIGEVVLPDSERAFVLRSLRSGANAPELLPLLHTYTSSSSYALTPDASMVVGDCRRGSPYELQIVPVFWNAQGVHPLEMPPGGSYASASRPSSDASAIIGYYSIGRETRAVLWRVGEPPIDLGNLPGTAVIIPYALSADGSIVVGWSRDQRDTEYVDQPFLWTARTGILDLKQLTAQFGGDFQHWQISSPSEISADGRTIIGFGIHDGEGEAFVLTLPPFCIADLDNDADPSNGGLPDFTVDINDLLYFLTLFQSGDPRIDLDDGSATGTPDNAVTIGDLLFFLTHFEAGC